MAYLSLLYGLTLLILAGLFWQMPRSPLRQWLLLIASVGIYCGLQPLTRIELAAILLLLTLLILLNFFLALVISRVSPPFKLEPSNSAAANSEEDGGDVPEALRLSTIQESPQKRNLLLIMGIGLNVLALLGFKYIPFFLQSLGAVSQAEWAGDRLIAPLGLSFFCFECLAYLIDVSRGAPPTPHLLSFATYKLFFPKLVAGPITRYHAFAQQWLTLQPPTVLETTEALWLIASGALKKGLLADHLAILVNVIFSQTAKAGSADLWLGTLAYGLQLYFDFSGYTDIVRGSARLLGITLPENFDFPYFSTSIADFWRRWHMTLGDWLRHYLYFPLGGSRRGVIRTCSNLCLVMLIAGLWHGAAWGYVVWGGVHGVALAIHRLMDLLARQITWVRQGWQHWGGQLLAWFFTQTTVFTAWILFRLPNLSESGWVLGHLVGHRGDAQFGVKVYTEALGVEPRLIVLLMGLVWVGMVGSYGLHRYLKLRLNWPFKLALIPCCFYLVWQFAPQGSLPYIYFDF